MQGSFRKDGRWALLSPPPWLYFILGSVGISNLLRCVERWWSK